MLNEKEIKQAASEYKIPRDRATFEQGVQWALEQMKQAKENPYKNYKAEISCEEYNVYATINAESVQKIDLYTLSVNGLVTIQFDEPISDLHIIKKP